MTTSIRDLVELTTWDLAPKEPEYEEAFTTLENSKEDSTRLSIKRVLVVNPKSVNLHFKAEAEAEIDILNGEVGAVPMEEYNRENFPVTTIIGFEDGSNRFSLLCQDNYETPSPALNIERCRTAYSRVMFDFLSRHLREAESKLSTIHQMLSDDIRTKFPMLAAQSSVSVTDKFNEELNALNSNIQVTSSRIQQEYFLLLDKLKNLGVICIESKGAAWLQNSVNVLGQHATFLEAIELGALKDPRLPQPKSE